MKYALDLSQITQAKNLIHKDLIAIASLLTIADLTNLDWNIITGVENEDTIYLYKANEAIARQYKPGHYLRAKLGAASERKLKVKNVWTQVYQNIQLFRENEPFSIIGVSEKGTLTTPVTESLLREMAKVFASQNLRNTIHGDESLGDSSPYSLFNGLNALIKADMTKGDVATGNGNLQLLGELDLDTVSDEAKVAAYEYFDKFVLGMDEDLQDEDKVDIMMGKKLYQFILQGAAIKFPNNPNLFTQTDLFASFFDRKNLLLKPTKIMGKGQEMVAYVPGAIDYASDMTSVGDPASAFIDLKTAQEDSNLLIAQMQVALGMRVNNVASSKFCVGLKDASTFNVGKTLKEEIETGEYVTPAPAGTAGFTSKEELDAYIAEKIAEGLAAHA